MRKPAHNRQCDIRTDLANPSESVPENVCSRHEFSHPTVDRSSDDSEASEQVLHKIPGETIASAAKNENVVLLTIHVRTYTTIDTGRCMYSCGRIRGSIPVANLVIVDCIEWRGGVGRRLSGGCVVFCGV